MVMNNELFERFIVERGIQERTVNAYVAPLKYLMESAGKSIEQLIIEADEEEMQGIRWKDRKLKLILIKYRLDLYNKGNLSEDTIKKYLRRVKTFFKHFEIEIGTIPDYTGKNVIKSEPIVASDIPTCDDLRLAIDLAQNQVMKAIISFMSSSGLAKVDALNLTIDEFIQANEGYYNSRSLAGIIDELSCSSDAVPTFKLRRQKTAKYFYTFCTPESVNIVANYLKTRKDLKLSDKLFKIADNYCMILFRELNELMGKKRKNKFSLFRSHMLRKFQAKRLYDSGMSIDDIDAIQGRSKDATHEAYFVTDPVVLKEKYMQHMDKLMLFTVMDYKSIESEEYLELKRENEKYRSKIDEQGAEIKELNKNQLRINEILGL